MSRATHATLHLARFESLRTASPVHGAGRPGVLFCNVAADLRGSGEEFADNRAFVFVMAALHSDEDSAHRLLDDYAAVAPWLSEARESWRAVLKPYRHRGSANHLDPANAGPVFEDAVLAQVPPAHEPIVVTTTAGWRTGPNLDMNRVRVFGMGVAGVRISMTGTPGLHSQQSFFFQDGRVTDAMTVTLWHNQEAMTAFAYGAGPHRHHMEKMQREDLSDRTSFTRHRVLRSEGTWYGSNPFAT